MINSPLQAAVKRQAPIDEMDPEYQRKAMEAIQQQAIQDNFDHAMCAPRMALQSPRAHALADLARPAQHFRWTNCRAMYLPQVTHRIRDNTLAYMCRCWHAPLYMLCCTCFDRMFLQGVHAGSFWASGHVVC